MDSSTTLGYTRSLAEARSCLAALADASPFERSVEYEQLLLELDAMHGGHAPATFPVPGSLSELDQRVEARLENLSDLGANPMRIELILARLNEIRTTGEGGISQVMKPAPRDRLTTRLTERLTHAHTGQVVASSAVRSPPSLRLREADVSAPTWISAAVSAGRRPVVKPDESHRGATMNTTNASEDTFVPTLLLAVKEAALRLGIGRTSMYRLVMTGEVESVQIGGLRRIPAPCLEGYVDRLRHNDPDPGA